MGFFSKGLKNEFEITVVNEPSVFEPLKLYYILKGDKMHNDCIACRRGKINFVTLILMLSLLFKKEKQNENKLPPLENAHCIQGSDKE